MAVLLFKKQIKPEEHKETKYNIFKKITDKCFFFHTLYTKHNIILVYKAIMKTT